MIKINFISDSSELDSNQNMFLIATSYFQSENFIIHEIIHRLIASRQCQNSFHLNNPKMCQNYYLLGDLLESEQFTHCQRVEV